MNLENSVEVEAFASWVEITHGADTARRFRELVRKRVEANRADLDDAVELAWKAHNEAHSDKISDAAEMVRSPFDSNIQLR